MLCAPHGNNVGAVVLPIHGTFPPPTFQPNSPLVATFVVWLKALDFRPQKLRLSSLLSVRQRVSAAQLCVRVRGRGLCCVCVCAGNKLVTCYYRLNRLTRLRL